MCGYVGVCDVWLCGGVWLSVVVWGCVVCGVWEGLVADVWGVYEGVAAVIRDGVMWLCGSGKAKKVVADVVVVLVMIVIMVVVVVISCGVEMSIMMVIVLMV